MHRFDADYVQPAGSGDNAARAYARIRVVPLASAMGAEIQGVDITHLDADTFADIADALYRHKMVYLRGQRLSHADQEQFTQRFGDFGVDAYTAGIAGHPHVQRVVKEASVRAPIIFGGSWHSDSPFLARPPAITLLYGSDIPPYGGDTLFANTVQAYRALSPAMQEALAPLRVRMSGRRVFAAVQRTSPAGQDAAIASMALDMKARMFGEGTLHPLVRTHPVTGERALYVDESYAVGIDGFSADEAAMLLDFLCAHTTQALFTCRLRWQPGTLALWDNRSCVHHAFNDHDGFRREMFRTIVAGEVPR